MGQKVTVVTFDLAVARKAYNLLWQNDAFKDVFVRLGSFHTICSFLGAIGKLMKGSGLAEIVIQSGICASGSIEQVFRGKHYNRALRVHKLMSEALERLLLIKFLDTCESKILEQVHDKTAALSKPSKASLQLILENESCQIMYEQYSVFLSKVRDGLLGKAVQFWLYYKDMVSIVLRFLRATRKNDMDLHIACIQDMCPLFLPWTTTTMLST